MQKYLNRTMVYILYCDNLPQKVYDHPRRDTARRMFDWRSDMPQTSGH